MPSLFIFVKYFFKKMAHNVPAAYDGLAARIRALRSKDQGRQTVPEQWRGNGALGNNLTSRNPEPPTGGKALTVLLCTVKTTTKRPPWTAGESVFFRCIFISMLYLSFSSVRHNQININLLNFDRLFLFLPPVF
jgi:hypothetical protein